MRNSPRIGKRRPVEDVTVQQSHGGSGSQARAVIEGLEADVVTLALSYDIDAIATQSEADRTRLDQTPAGQFDAVYIDDRAPRAQGQSEGHSRLGRRCEARRCGDRAESENGRRRALELPRCVFVALKRNHNDDAKARAFVAAVYKNVTVLDAASRASTVNLRRTRHRRCGTRVGKRSDSRLASAPGQYEIIVPSVSILAEPPVAWVDANVAKHNTLDVSKAYLEYLYTGRRTAARMQMGLSSARNRDPRQMRHALRAHRSDDDRELRRLECGAGTLLCRRRRLRPDLHAEQMIPGRGLALGITLTVISLVVLIPLAAIVITATGDSPAHLFAAAFSPRAAGRISHQRDLRARRVGDRRRGRRRHRRRARALSVGGHALFGCARRRAVCDSDGRYRHHARNALRPARLGRNVSRRARNCDRVYARGHRARACLCGPAVRRSDRAADRRNVAARIHRGGEFARRIARYDPSARDAAAGDAVVADRLCAWRSRERSANTARSFSSPGTCRSRRRSRRS